MSSTVTWICSPAGVSMMRVSPGQGAGEDEHVGLLAWVEWGAYPKKYSNPEHFLTHCS